MRNVSMSLNSIIVVFFVCFVGYTFIAQQHLEGLAREFVTVKTIEHSKPVVNLTEASLDSPLVKTVLSEETQTLLRNEIAEYRADESAYIADLTRQEILPNNPPAQNPVLQKFSAAKEKIRQFYDKTLAALITDLRIFSTCNLIAGLLACWLAYRSKEKINQSLIWFTFLMFGSVVYSSYLYIDDLSFFRILFRMHMGWWYFVSLGLVLAGLFWDYGRIPNSDVQIEKVEHSPEPVIVES